MNIVTLRLTRRGSSRLELKGERLLVGAADTGVFKIVAPGPPPAAPLPVPRLVCRDAGDGLASTFIDSDAPLAVACDDAPHDPYNRWTLTTRAATRSRPR